MGASAVGAIPELMGCLDETIPQIRIAIVGSLMEIGAEANRLEEVLPAILEIESPEVLGRLHQRMGGARAVEGLVKVMPRLKEAPVWRALRLLNSMRPMEIRAESLLSTALWNLRIIANDSSVRVRREAIVCAGWLLGFRESIISIEVTKEPPNGIGATGSHEVVVLSVIDPNSNDEIAVYPAIEGPRSLSDSVHRLMVTSSVGVVCSVRASTLSELAQIDQRVSRLREWAGSRLGFMGFVCACPMQIEGKSESSAFESAVTERLGLEVGGVRLEALELPR
jgi:hypothetical protein